MNKWNTGAISALTGATALLGGLLALAGPVQSQSAKDLKKSQPHFQTSDRCFACHNNLVSAAGEDVSIAPDWRATMMANSARDPYWQAGVRRESLEHPESKAAIEDECSICHMPMARYEDKLAKKSTEMLSRLPFAPGTPNGRIDVDGVSCSVCHQITKEKLGTRESFNGGFVIDTMKPAGEKSVYGPYKIEDGHKRIMRTSSGGFLPTESDHIRSSELCATCHTLITQALGPGGKVIGSLPEQMPYQEWLHSDFKDKQSCQNCHMPEVKDAPITRVLGVNRETMGRHVFVGANFFMQRMLNKFRGELGVWALPQELTTAANRTVDYLQNQTARVRMDNVQVASDRLEADVVVQSLGGHKFPTGYPSRRTWLHFTVRDRNGKLLFESGALNPDGSITGNDNDADANRFEPHYTRITGADQVQIYEAIMGDSAKVPTTGLLNAIGYLKDNRLLPKGFNKATADQEIAPQGEAMSDPDFAGGGDQVHYSISVLGAQGPFQIDAELWYQPTGFRWANNLRKYDAPEPKRFVGYWDSMANTSGVLVTKASAAR